MGGSERDRPPREGVKSIRQRVGIYADACDHVRRYKTLFIVINAAAQRIKHPGLRASAATSLDQVQDWIKPQGGLEASLSRGPPLIPASTIRRDLERVVQGGISARFQSSYLGICRIIPRNSNKTSPLTVYCCQQYG